MKLLFLLIITLHYTLFKCHFNICLGIMQAFQTSKTNLNKLIPFTGVIYDFPIIIINDIKFLIISITHSSKALQTASITFKASLYDPSSSIPTSKCFSTLF